MQVFKYTSDEIGLYARMLVSLYESRQVGKVESIKVYKSSIKQV